MEIDQEYIEISRKAIRDMLEAGKRLYEGLHEVIRQIIEEISKFGQEVLEHIRKENRTRLPRPPKKILQSKEAPVFEIRARARSRC